MLGRLIVILLQIAAGWFVGPTIRQYIPVSGPFDLFLYAVIFAVVVYLVGLLASLVIKNIATPSPAALTSSIVVALLAAAFATFGLAYVPEIPGVPLIPGNTITQRGITLAGAILGYMIRR